MTLMRHTKLPILLPMSISNPWTSFITPLALSTLLSPPEISPMTNETADLFIQHEEQMNGAPMSIMDDELERMASELEVTVDYLMMEFL